MKNIAAVLMLFTLFLSCQQKEKATLPDLPDGVQAISLLGDTLETDIEPLPEELGTRINSLGEEALADSLIADHLIWKGRSTAYSGDYRKAVEEFSEAIEQFPEDARLYRHRGHRYLTLREFDLAIIDFEKAEELFEDEKDITEPDGLPNAENIPLSSLQTNTWYHLGLAHYLQGNYEEANEAYRKGIRVTTNDDMLTAFLYWYYMSLRKAGDDVTAGNVLDAVQEEMDIIENESYHNLLLVFQGTFKSDALFAGDESELENATLGYGLGFWHSINGREKRAEQIWQQVYDAGNWAAFGFIASEAELAGK
ncbi:MAG: tetratricopeptide repeat protein [Balneolaceae bacterium]